MALAHAALRLTDVVDSTALSESLGDARMAALWEAHDRVAREGVRLAARAGLHLGPVILRENTPEDVARGAKPLEVEGLAKPTAARLMSLGAGGQTLVSGPAMDAAGALPEGLDRRLHG